MSDTYRCDTFKCDTFRCDTFRDLQRHLNFSSQRHNVIASNIANIDTPGYQAQDIRFKDALSEATLRLRTTHPCHIPSPGNPCEQAFIEPVEQSHWGDKNNVELDMEVAKMTENGIFFQAASTLLSKNIAMYKAAMRRS
ncbi:MAG: flagellar basal body rod protein FlgB [Syntrophorhabdaceae bacterium]|nr:flagellar basal body rod protein FlgB [Syntrophorhabdaceae bacterium]